MHSTVNSKFPLQELPIIEIYGQRGKYSFLSSDYVIKYLASGETLHGAILVGGMTTL